MMNLPTIPTDSVYKFAAIAGVAMVISSNYFGSLNVTSMLEQREAIRKAHWDWYHTERWRSIDSVQKDHPTLEKRLPALKGMLTDLNEFAKLQWNDHGERRITEIEAEAMNSALLLQKMERIGYGLMILGFLCWLMKVQRFQDGILRLDFETAKREFEKNHPSESEKVTTGWLKWFWFKLVSAGSKSLAWFKRQWSWLVQRLGRK